MFPNVFTPDLFSSTALTAAINQQPYVPGIIGAMGLFEEEGVPTTSVVIERVKGQLALVSTSKRGAVGNTQADDKRNGVILNIPHLQVNDALLADSVQNVREFGTNDQLRAVESARDSKLNKAALNLDMTLEYHRLGAIQGIVLDADGSTPILNVFTAFNVAQPTEIDFDLDNATPASGALRTACAGVWRGVTDALGNAPFTGIRSLCGNTFYDQLVAHPEARASYLNQQEAKELRTGLAYRSFNFGDIEFINYRGSGAVAVGSTKAKFFPVGVPGLFITRFGPADYMEAVNTIGLPRYAKAEPMKMDKGLELEAQTNPLNLCTIPEVLFSARNT